MRFIALFLSAALLSGCVDWPDIPVSPSAEASDWPVLLPLEDIGAAPLVEDREQAIETLQRRAAGLRARARVLRQPVVDDAAMERLRQALARS